MGMFDRILVPCPKCGEMLEYQSKAGPCSLHDYRLDTAPASILGDIAGEKGVCPECHEVVRIVVSVRAWAESAYSPHGTERILGREDDYE